MTSMEPGAQFKMANRSGGFSVNVRSEPLAPDHETGESAPRGKGMMIIQEPWTHYHMGPSYAKPGHQIAAFTPEHHPAEVDSAFFDKGAKHHFGTTLGIAMAESHARGWGTPVPSASLSEHSAPIVQRLVAKGVIKNPQDNDPDEPLAHGAGVGVTNNEDWQSGHDIASHDWSSVAVQSAKDLTPGQVGHGRGTLRNALRGGEAIPGQASRSVSKKQFKQLSISD